MARRTWRNHGSAFKAKVALEAMKEQHTLVELGRCFQVHPNWRAQSQIAASDNPIAGSRIEAGMTGHVTGSPFTPEMDMILDPRPPLG